MTKYAAIKVIKKYKRDAQWVVAQQQDMEQRDDFQYFLNQGIAMGADFALKVTEQIKQPSPKVTH